VPKRVSNRASEQERHRVGAVLREMAESKPARGSSSAIVVRTRSLKNSTRGEQSGSLSLKCLASAVFRC